jgi:hypothetical protein
MCNSCRLAASPYIRSFAPTVLCRIARAVGVACYPDLARLSALLLAGREEGAAADRRAIDALVGALKENDAELGLELGNLVGEGGLADVAGFSGAANMAMLGHGDEIAESLEDH